LEKDPYETKMTVTSTADPFQYKNYTIRKQMLKVFGGSFRIYEPGGSLVLFASMKAFKLKEDIRLYTREDKAEEVLTIKARSIIDFSATYDVMDPATGQPIGALQRKGVKSMIQDEWQIFDALGVPIGAVKEDSLILALIRRFATNLVPQQFHGTVQGDQVFTFHQNFNPFTLRYELDFSSDVMDKLDRRLGIAMAVLLCAIESRQN